MAPNCLGGVEPSGLGFSNLRRLGRQVLRRARSEWLNWLVANSMSVLDRRKAGDGQQELLRTELISCEQGRASREPSEKEADLLIRIYFVRVLVVVHGSQV